MSHFLIRLPEHTPGAAHGAASDYYAIELLYEKRVIGPLYVIRCGIGVIPSRHPFQPRPPVKPIYFHLYTPCRVVFLRITASVADEHGHFQVLLSGIPLLFRCWILPLRSPTTPYSIPPQRFDIFIIPPQASFPTRRLLLHSVLLSGKCCNKQCIDLFILFDEVVFFIPFIQKRS